MAKVKKSYSSIKASWKNPDSENVGKKKAYKDIKSTDVNYGVDEDYINTFIRDSQNHLKNAQMEYDSLNYGNVKMVANGYNERSSELRKRANTIRAYLNTNRENPNLDFDTYKEPISYLDAYSKDSSSYFQAFRNAESYYSQWEDEESYKRGYNHNNYSKKYEGKTYADLMGAKTELEKQLETDKDNEDLNSELSWLNKHKTDKQFVDTMTDDELKQYKEDNVTKVKELKSKVAKLKQEKYAHERGGQAGANNQRYQTVLKELESAEKELKGLDTDSIVLYDDEVGSVTVDDVLTSRENEGLLAKIEGDENTKSAYEKALKANENVNALSKQLSDIQNQISYYQSNNLDTTYLISQANSIASAIDNNKAVIEEFNSLGYDFESLEHYKRNKESRANYNETQKENYEYGKENWLGAKAYSTFVAPIGSIADFIGNKYEEHKYGYANVYDDEYINKMSAYSSATAEATGDAFEKAASFFGASKKLSEGIGTIATMADSGISSALQSTVTGVVATALCGGNAEAGATVALSLLAAQSASSKYSEKIRQGSTSDEATLTALASGLAEAMFERIPLDNLFKAAKSGSIDTVSALLKTMAKQGAIEGLEELGTEVTNTMADAIINGDHSAYQTSVRKYMSQGYSETDAKKIASEEWMEEVLSAFVGGMFGGLAMGGVASTGSYVADNMHYNQMGEGIVEKGNVPQLVSDAKSIDGASDKLLNLANEVAGVKTENMSKHQSKNYAHDVGQLYKGVQKEQAKSIGKVNSATLKEALAKELNENSVENAETVADALVKATNKGRLTKSESKLVADANGLSVLSKVLNEVQKSQEHKDKVEQATIKTFETTALPYAKADSTIQRETIDVSGYEISQDGTNKVSATGDEVKINRIVSFDVENDDVNVALDNGENISIAEMSVNEDTAVIINGLKALNKNNGMNVETANTIMAMFNKDMGIDAKTFILGAETAYRFAYSNAKPRLAKDVFTSQLPANVRESIYELGRKTIESNAKAKQVIQDKLKSQGRPNVKVGKVTYKNVTRSELTKEQKAMVDYAEFISNVIGFELEIFRSPKNASGQSIGKSGSWSIGTQVMALDVDAGEINGVSLMVITQSHELTHMIKQRSPEQFELFADMLFEKYGKISGVRSIDSLIKDKIEKNRLAYIKEVYELEKKGRPASEAQHKEVLSYDEAKEEVVASLCENFLKDSNAYELMQEIAQKDKGLFNTIKRFIKNLVERLKNAIKAIENSEYKSLSNELQKLAKEDYQELVDKWTQLLMDSRLENITQAEQDAIEAFGDDLGTVETNENGDVTLISNKDNSTLMYSETTWNDGGKDALILALTRNEHTQEEIVRTVKMVEDTLDYLKILAAGDAQMRGYTELANHLIADITTDIKGKKQVLHAIVNNGDYPVNIDLALICKKRVAYMNVMTRLIADGVMENVKYDGDAIAEVNAILRKNGFETACLGCFVESRRLQFQTWAETIVQEWNGEVDKRNKNAGSFNYTKNALTDASSLTEEELEQLEKELEGKETNAQGNLNLGKGGVRLKMGKLLDAAPTLQKHISVADLLTPEGLTKLRAENPNLFSLVKSRYGAATPKIVQKYNPYASELANLTFSSVKGITTNAVSGSQEYLKEARKELENSKPVLPKGMKQGEFNESQEMQDWNAKVETLAMRKYLYDIGGARMQSFSDFMIENVFDYMQIFADLSANKFPLHSYTKEIAFLRLFGMTGAKINGSLIAHVDKSLGKKYAGLLPKEEAEKGNAILVHTEDGDFAIGFDDYSRHMATKGTDGETFIQSIGMKDIIALQMDKRYSSNIGSITIGVSDIQILAMLDSPLFRMVIPYHASGMLPQFAKLVGVDLYNDYTDYQNTTVKQYYDLNKMPLPDEVKKGKSTQGKLRNANGDEIKADTSYNFNAELQRIGDPKQVANNYVAWCNEFHEVYDGDTLVGYAKFSPKFSNSPYGTDFTKHENYYKLLEDFNVYDGITEQYAAQGAVEMIFPSAETKLSAQEMEEYKQRLRDTGLYTEKEIEKYVNKADMTFEEIIKAEVKGRIDYEDSQSPKWESTVEEIKDKLNKDFPRINQRIKNYDSFVKLKDSKGKKAAVTLKESRPLENTYDYKWVSDMHFQDRTPLEDRVTGDDLLDAQDLIETIKSVGGTVTDNGYVTLYHCTSKENADKIIKSGFMIGKEDGLFFSTNKTGYNDGYGDSVVEFSIPVEKVMLDDIFDNEAHLRLAMSKAGKMSVKRYLVNTSADTMYQDRVTPEEDAEYLELAKNPEKNEARLREMVDMAAKKAGYNTTTWHGTNKDFTVFNTIYDREFGYHTGTESAAKSRVEYELNPRVLQLYTKLGKTIQTPDIYGLWAGMHDYIFYVRGELDKVGDLDSLNELNRKLKFGNKFPHNEALDRLHETYLESEGKYSKMRLVQEATQEYLKSIGVDSISYKNAYEAKGSTSYLLMDSNQVKSADLVTYDDEGNIIPLSERFNDGNEDIRYSERVTDTETLDFLNEQIEKGEFVKVYRSFQLIDGGLYAPMNAVDRDENGKNKKLGYRSEYGVWEQATESIEIAQKYMDSHPDAPYAKFDLDGVDNKTNGVAYNPYLHSSNLVLNDQFSAAYRRNLITVECYVPLSEADGSYKAQYAKNATGWADWKAGGVAGKLFKLKPEYTRKLFLSRYMLPVRQVPDAEVAAMYKEYLDGTDIAVPWNVVTPSLRQELEKVGVAISYKDVKQGKKVVRYSDVFPNESIAYQDRAESTSNIAEVMGLNKDLEKQNKKLKEDVADLNELLKLQKKVTNGKMFTKSSVEKMSTMLWHKFGLNRVNEDQKKDLAQRLNAYYSYIAQGEELTWEEVMNRASEIARWADNEIPEKISRDEYAQEILDTIRSIDITLDDIQKQEVAHQYGSYNDFRKANMGSIKLVKDGVSLDSQWQEWAEMYPDMFDADTNPADMPIALVETIATLKATDSAIEQYDINEKTRWMAEEIYDGYWGVSTLYTVADKYQKDINILKSKHTEKMNYLRETYANREKMTKDKFNDMLKKVKTDERAKLEAYKKLKKEQQQNARERRNKTAIKNKFKRVVKELNTLLNNGTKEKNVKIDLQPTVAKALELAEYLFEDEFSNEFILTRAGVKPRADEQETYNKWVNAYKTKQEHLATIESLANKEGGATTIANLNDAIRRLDNRMKTYEKQLSSLITEARSNINNDGVTNAVNALADAYAELKNSKEDYIKGAYNDGVYEVIKQLADGLSGTKISDMTNAQMQQLYDAFKMVLYAVRTSNELFLDGKKVNVEEISLDILRELSDMKGTKNIPNEKLDQIKGAIDAFSWDEEKPYYAFNRIGSKTLMKLYEDARKAEDVLGKDYNEAIQFAQKTMKKYRYDSWDMDKAYDVRLSNGRTIKLSLQELMSIYAYSKREQALDHMKFGGFVFNDKKFFKKTKKNGIKQTVRDMSAEAYTFDETDLATVTGLIKEQVGFVDEMQDYLSTVMGAKGNEISRQLYGVDWFKEKYYFPLKSSHDFLAVVNQVSENYSLRNSGMTKATVPHAKNPIVLEDFVTVWSNHVGKMSTYHALVLPIDNLNKALSYKGQSISVKSTLKSVYGKSVENYIDNFIKDLNGGITSQGATSPLAKFFGKFKKTAVSASASVVVQQPTAILRAMTEIDSKHFVGKSDKLKHKEKWELIKKYAPIAVLKEIGGFDIGSGRQLENIITSKSYDGIKKIGGAITDSNYRDEVLMRPAGLADEIGWNIIWSAVEREISATTDLKTGTEEFYQAVGERFTEVVHKTQVYDSTFTRSGYQRSKSDLVKMSMAFMGEPTTSFNMMLDAVTQVARGNISKGSAIRILGFTVASTIMAAVAKSFVYALRDDDEDESYAEKYASSLTDNLISDMHIHNMLPFVKDIISLFNGWDVERTDMAVFKDIKDALDGLDSATKSPYRKMEDLLGAIASAFGLPLKNLMRTGRELWNVGKNISDDNTASEEDIRKAIHDTVHGEDSMKKANELLDKGNTSRAKEMITDILNEKADKKVAEGMSREKAIKEAKSSIRSSLTSEWKSKYVQAYNNRNTSEMNEIRKLLHSTGIYGTLSELDETLEDWRKPKD